MTNSYFGKKGAIGYRAAKIIETFSDTDLRVICRSFDKNSPDIIYQMPSKFRYFSKVLKFFKIVFPFFSTHLREIEANYFEIICLEQIKTNVSFSKVDVVHIWEYCPKISKFFSDNSIPVVQEVPIMPAFSILNMKANHNFKQSQLFSNRQKLSFDLASSLAIPSGFVFKALSKKHQRKSTVVTFGVDTALTKVGEEFINSEKRASNFCFIGAATPRKGIYEVIEAFSDEKLSDADLNIYGKASIFFVAKLKIFGPRNVHFRGFVDINLIGEKNFSLVLPSWIEGSSKAVFEAMAMGMAVIVTPNCGSVVKNSYDGFVIQPGSKKDLVEAIIKLKNNPELSNNIGLNAINTAKKYEWKTYAHKLMKLYSKTIQEARYNAK